MFLQNRFSLLVSCFAVSVLLFFAGTAPVLCTNPVKSRELLETRHREYLQALESRGPEAVETRLAFDRYMLAYKRHQQASGVVDKTAPSHQQTGQYQDLIEDGPGVSSDVKIGNIMIKSGNVSSAMGMYKMAFSRALISPVKVFFMRIELFMDNLFGPKYPEDFDISDITPPPPPPDIRQPPIQPPVEQRKKPPRKEDTSWIGDFKYERIMSDSSFINVNSMSEREVQDFLEKRGSVLAKPYRGQMPSSLIMEACRKHQVSPKVILARLQTEQGLISKKSATQHQLDWALGVGCYDSGNWNTKYKGLGKQIEYAAVTLKNHYDRGKDRIGQNGVIAMTIDGSPMRIQNSATYSMYKYCPHKHGNKLFYDVYMGFFALLLFMLGVIFL